MPISIEEVSLAWAKQLMRAEQAESRIKELEAELANFREQQQAAKPAKKVESSAA